jgi:hypothetical protein
MRKNAHWVNTGQTLGKHWVNTGQTLGKHWANTGQIELGIDGGGDRWWRAAQKSAKKRIESGERRADGGRDRRSVEMDPSPYNAA